ncbi:MAG: hypothetical protein MUC63_10215, partial [Planctomycetes bacterium]|nr:hypothetical protein [Planctomycetota bacterium]
MKPLPSALAALLSLAAAAGAQEKAPPPAPAFLRADLVAVATPQRVERSPAAEGAPAGFRMTFAVLRVLAGRPVAKGKAEVELPSPLPEAWAAAAKAVLAEAETPFLLSLKARPAAKGPARFVPAEGETARPVAPGEEAKIAAEIGAFAKARVAELDAEDFATREKAEADLARLGAGGEAALREALEKGATPEVTMRARRVLENLPRPAAASRWVIHQPNENYPNDEVIVWKDQGRSQRAFLLPPGEEVENLEEVDGAKSGSPHVMCRIRTRDGREGWVPKPWLRLEAGEPGALRPLRAGEKMTEEFFEAVWTAVGRESRRAFKKTGSFDEINEAREKAARQAGFASFNEFVARAARDIPPDRFRVLVQKVTSRYTQELERMTRERAAGGE